MWTWLLVITLILVGALGGFIFLTQPQKKTLSLDTQTEQLSEKVLGQTKIDEDSKELVAEGKDSLKDQIQQAADGVNNFIEEKVSQILGEKKAAPEVKVVSESEEVFSDVQLVFDFKSDKNKKVILKKGVKYLLDFQNIPEGFCLLIGGVQYQLDQQKKLLLSFGSSGSFPLKMDFCQATQKDLGEFLVE